METIPLLSSDLIAQLDEHYSILPADALHPDGLHVYNHAQGQRSVVEFLQLRLAQTKEEELNV